MEALSQISNAQTARHLQFPIGTYVEGRMRSDGRGTDLILREAGQPDRALLVNAQDVQTFRFVTRSTDSRLLLRQNDRDTSELSLTRTIRPEQQGSATDMGHGVGPESLRSPRLRALAAQEVDPDSFWRDLQREGTPLVEPDPEGHPDWRLLTFLWRGARRNARLVGAPAPDHVWMERLQGTDLWFASFRVPGDLRLSYRIAPDIPDIQASARENRWALLAVAQADPLNPAGLFPAARDSFAQWSLCDLSSCGSGSKAAPVPVVPKLTHDIVEHRLPDPWLAGGRKIWIHRPQGFVPGTAGNVLLILFDGATYLHDLDLPCRIESLLQAGEMAQIATVYVDTVSPARRSIDLACNDEFADHLVTRILPLASTRIGQDFDPQQVVVAGSSFGGLAAAHAVLRHPEKTSNFISLSGSFWWGPQGWHDPVPYVASLPVARSLRAVLSAGAATRWPATKATPVFWKQARLLPGTCRNRALRPICGSTTAAMITQSGQVP